MLKCLIIINKILIFTLIILSCKNEVLKNKEYYADGSLMSEAEVIIDNRGKKIKDGLFFMYLPDGKKIEMKTFKNDTLNGSHIKWYPNGNKKLEENYKNGKLDGKRIHYKYGKLTSEETWKNGQMNGPFVSYYPSGKIMDESNVLNGVHHGVRKRYGESGVILSEQYYDNGQEVENNSPPPKPNFQNAEVNRLVLEFENNYNKTLPIITKGNSANIDKLGRLLDEEANYYKKISALLEGTDEWWLWSNYYTKMTNKRSELSNK